MSESDVVRGRFSALQHRQFLIFWLGSFASVSATQLQIMAQGWLVYELTGSPLMLGYLGAAAGVPAIAMTFFGGALADRLHKKYLLLFTSALTASLLFLLAILDASEMVLAWHVIGITGLISLVSGLDWPTRQAIFPAFIERDDMMSAIALNSIVWQSCRMIFPAFGGLIIAIYDTWVVFALCGTGFAAMIFIITLLDVPAPAPRQIHSTLRQVAEGIRYIFHHRVFLLLIMLSYTSMLLGATYMQLMPAFSALLAAGSTGFGYLLSATGVGSVTGTLLISSMQHTRHLGWIILGASACSALCVYLFALITAFAGQSDFAMVLAMAAAFGIALFASVFLIASMTVLQLAVPDTLRGRVMGLHGITYSLMPLGGLIAGAIASLSSAPVAVSVCATAYLVIIVLTALGGTVPGIDGRQPGAGTTAANRTG